VLDEVRRSLSNIVGRLHAQQSGTSGEQQQQQQSSRAGAVTPTAYSTAAGRGQDGGGRAGAKSPQDGGLGVPPPGGAEVDEGYDASLQSDGGFSNGLHGNQRARVVVLESEIQRLTRLVDGYRAARSDEEHSATRSVEMMRAGALQAAQSDVRRLQLRVSELETDKLQLQRDMNKTR